VNWKQHPEDISFPNFAAGNMTRPKKFQSLSSNHKIRTIIKTVPKIPLGPYPQPELCGHDGKAPISNKIRMITNTVPSMASP
jgi:hypothetical protein